MNYDFSKIPEDAESDKVEMLLCSNEIESDLFAFSNTPRELGDGFREIMNVARKFGVADKVEEHYKSVYPIYKGMNNHGIPCYPNLTLPELWETPRPLELSALDEPIPLKEQMFLPFLWEYIKAVAASIQVYPEMCVLPLLSVLSLCVQDKAVIKDPWKDYTETLNLYTLTVGGSGERKTPTLKTFQNPVISYQANYNTSFEHQQKKAEYQAEHDMLLTERKTLTNAKKNKDPEQLKQVIFKLQQLKPVNDLLMFVGDTTPEALIDAMAANGEKMGILSDEGATLQHMCGLHSNGTANIDVYLQSYNRSYLSSRRRTSAPIEMYKPTLTIGIMTQSGFFGDVINNPQLDDRGVIARLLFSFPKEKAGYVKHNSPNVPEELKRKYTEIIYRLLKLPPSDTPLIVNRASARLLEDYFDSCQKAQRKGGKFHYGQLKTWMSKQFGRCLRIVGIFHLCEHEPTEEVAEDTTFAAINLCCWLEGQALKALGNFSEEQYFKDAKYLLDRLEKVEPLFSVRDISLKSKYRNHKGEGTQKVYDLLKLLESYGYVEEIEPEPFSRRDASPKFKKNPLYM